MDNNNQDGKPAEVLCELFYAASDLHDKWPEGARIIREAALALEEEIGAKPDPFKSTAVLKNGVNAPGTVRH